MLKGRKRLTSKVLSVIFLESFVLVKFKFKCLKIILETTFCYVVEAVPGLRSGLRRLLSNAMNPAQPCCQVQVCKVCSCVNHCCYSTH